MNKKKIFSYAESKDCFIEETACGNIWLNAPDGLFFASSGATTSLLFSGDQRDRSGKKIKPCWKEIFSVAKEEIDFGFEK